MSQNTIPPHTWLERILTPGRAFSINIVRYIDRKGAYHSADLPLKTHMITMVTQGTLRATLNDIETECRAGECWWLPPGTQRVFHSTHADSHIQQYNIRFTLGPKNNPLTPTKHCLHLFESWELVPYFQMLLDTYLNPSGYHIKRTRGLLGALCGAMLAYDRDQRHQSGQAQRLHRGQIGRIHDILSKGIRDGIEPRDLAKSMQLSLDYFTRLFRKTFGIPPRSYIKQFRIRYAAQELLETNQTVSQVANSVGVVNVSLFCRQFRDIMGCTPNTYRQKGFITKREKHKSPLHDATN